MKHYTLTVTVLEDLHTGSGTGAGGYDALLARDRNGLPVIPASHWLGVWRDNLQRCRKAQKRSLDDCHALFGKSNGQRGSLTATSLYCQDRDIESISWTSTSREPDSRAPKENTLRTREFIPAGSRFAANIWLADEQLAETMQLACRLTDRLGGRRQRGDGRINACLKQTAPEARTLPNATNGTVLRLLLRAHDPVCLPITGHPGNLIRSECYIRGQVLRGALLGNLLRQGQNELAQMLFKDSFRVANAYPLPLVEIPSTDDWRNWNVLPMPLHYEIPKPGGGGEDGWPWWALPEPPGQPKDQFDREPKGEKLKRPADNAFIFSKGGNANWQSFNAPLVQRLRNGQPTTKHPDGALFAQEEIPENTLFLTEIEFSDSDLASRTLIEFQTILGGSDCLNLGRGGAPVTIEGWSIQEPETVKPASRGESSIRITLISDLIARSPSLGFYQSLSPQVLLELCDLSPNDFPEAANWTGSAFCDHVEVYGFNAMTGLPRLPVTAIRRGSSITLTGQGLADMAQALRKRRTLGERSAEGFGRFIVDFAPQITAPSKRMPEPQENPAEYPAEYIYERARQAFNELKTVPLEHWPKLAQWQALRYHENPNGKSLADQIEVHKCRLDAKKDTQESAQVHIAWLKPMPGSPNRQSWIAWLLAHLNVIEPEHQRLFYRALLAQIRQQLRKQGEHHD